MMHDMKVPEKGDRVHHNMLDINHEIEKNHGDGELHAGREFPIVQHSPPSFLGELRRTHRRSPKQ